MLYLKRQPRELNEDVKMDFIGKVAIVTGRAGASQSGSE